MKHRFSEPCKARSRDWHGFCLFYPDALSCPAFLNVGVHQKSVAIQRVFHDVRQSNDANITPLYDILSDF
jgi:hypothetical protein